MFDLRASGIAAGIAFVVSFLVGLLSRAAFPVLLVRALGFAVLFFIISGLVYLLISRFLPELLDERGLKEEMDLNVPGSRINISEGGPQGPVPAVPGMVFAQADDSEEGLGNISALAAAPQEDGTAPGYVPGLDQGSQSGYTEKSGLELFAEGDDAPAAEAVSMDTLPDLDSLAGAFLPSSENDEGDTTEYSISAPAKKPLAGSKGRKMEGDFNPKDLAAGIRTILKKEGE
jgi:hypothetical protein